MSRSSQPGRARPSARNMAVGSLSSAVPRTPGGIPRRPRCAATSRNDPPSATQSAGKPTAAISSMTKSRARRTKRTGSWGPAGTSRLAGCLVPVK